MSERELISLSIDVEAQPVKLFSERNGKDEEIFEIREMSGTNRDKWMQTVQNRTRFVKGKPRGLKSMEGMTEELLCLCMYNSDGHQVKKETIKKWPGRVQGKLFEVALSMSGLDRPEENDEQVVDLLDKLDGTIDKLAEVDVTTTEGQDEVKALIEDYHEITEALREVLELTDTPQVQAKNG